MNVFNDDKLNMFHRLAYSLEEYIYQNDTSIKVMKSEEAAIIEIRSTAKMMELIDEVSNQILAKKIDSEEKIIKLRKNDKCLKITSKGVMSFAILLMITVLALIFIMPDTMKSKLGFGLSIFLAFGAPFIILCCGRSCEMTKKQIDHRIRKIDQLSNQYHLNLVNMDVQLGLIIKDNDQEERTTQLLETKKWFSLLNNDIFCSLIYNMFKRLKEINKDEIDSKLLPWRTIETRRDALLKFRYKEIQSSFPSDIWELIKDYV